MIIINGINSEIVQKILHKFLKNNKVIGIYNTKYSGIHHKNLKILKKSQQSLKQLIKLINKESKIVFLDFAAKRDSSLILKFNKTKFLNSINNNLIDTLNIIKLILPHMIKNNFGRIIFASSSTADNGSIGNLGYSATKAALSGVSGTLAKEYKNYNITSNILSLGYFKSRMWTSLPEKNKKYLMNNTLKNNFCDEKAIYEIIKVIIKFNTINMSKISIDGGNLLK